jgi:outer membrane protein assembly factor BamD (BamD/ComL family)
MRSAHAFLIIICCLTGTLFARSAERQKKVTVTVYSFENRLLLEADSLLKMKNFESATIRYAKIRNDYPKSNAAIRAQYQLSLVFTHFDNPFADYNAALREFKRFAETYPDDERITMARNWIRVLTLLQEYAKNYQNNTGQLKDVKDRQNSVVRNYESLQDSYVQCNNRNDSLSRRIQILEGIIAQIDKLR